MEKEERRAAAAAFKARRRVGGVYCIKNTGNGKLLLAGSTDLNGSENRFRFEQMTDSCFDSALASDWKQYGAKAFAFEVLETLEQNEDQEQAEFAEDIAVLLDFWLERTPPETLYSAKPRVL